MPVRPTRRAYALTGAAVILFLVGMNVQAGWLYVLAASFLGVVLAGLLVPPLVLRGIKCTRTAPRSARARDPITAKLDIRTKGFAGGLLWGRDTFLSESSFLAENIKKPGVTIEYTIRGARRGAFDGAGVEIASGFPFGVGVAGRNVFVESPIIVHPRWFELRGFPLLEAVSSPNEAMHDRRRRGSGMEFYGIRDYRSGDSIRHVHWPSAARTGRLMVREFEDQPASRLGIFLDTSAGTHEVFEDAISCAASIVMYALSAGHPVQLFCDTRSVTRHLFEPGTTEALDWLARIHPAGRGGLNRLVREFAGEVQPRSTNVVLFATALSSFSGVLDAVTHLQSLNSRVIAVAVSASGYRPSLQGSMSPEEEEAFLDRLTSARALVYRVTAGSDLAERLEEPYHV
jgi:uncharacterized protein (DUF58 family)